MGHKWKSRKPTGVPDPLSPLLVSKMLHSTLPSRPLLFLCHTFSHTQLPYILLVLQIHYTDQASLELSAALLTQLSKCWDCAHESQPLACSSLQI